MGRDFCGRQQFGKWQNNLPRAVQGYLPLKLRILSVLPQSHHCALLCDIQTPPNQRTRCGIRLKHLEQKDLGIWNISKVIYPNGPSISKQFDLGARWVGCLNQLVPQIDPSVPQPVFAITEKAPTRAFSWLKAPTSAFTCKTLLRHYAKQALTPR